MCVHRWEAGKEERSKIGGEIMVTSKIKFDPHLSNHPDALVCV